jgi:long-subunit fatty acid transport protein
MRLLSFSLPLSLLLLVMPLQAQEESAIASFGGVGVRAMGMGGAFTGVADDFTAVFWNPAGLAQIRHYEVYMGFQSNSFQNDSRQAGNPTSTEVNNTRFGSLGVVVPYPVHQGSLVLAAGFNRVNDFDRSLQVVGFSQIDTLSVNDEFANEGELSTLSLAAAVDVSPTISLGLTLNRTSGESESVSDFRLVDSQDLYEERRFVAREVFEDSYKPAWSATLGAMLRAPVGAPKMRAGATLSTGRTQKIDYTFTGVPLEFGFDRIEYDDGTIQEQQPEVVKGSYKLSLPLEIGLGAAYEPLDGLVLAAGTHLTAWSQSEYDGDDNLGLRANSALEDQYDDLVRYHLGLEYQVPVVALDLRAGYYTDPLAFVGPRDPQSEIDAIANPIIQIKQDRRYITLGAGLLFDEVVQADVAWTRGTFEQVEGELVEEGTISRLFIGVSYRFQ